MTPQPNPTFQERIEDIESNIRLAEDIREYYRTIGKDTLYINHDIAEYCQELAEVRSEMARYNEIVI